MSKLRKILIIALLSGGGAILGIVESMLPILPAIPGGKLGLANIVTVSALYILGGWETILISIVRTVVSSALYGGFNAFIYSFSGALLSTIVMIGIKKMLNNKVSSVGISVAGAATHNIAQVAVAWCIVRSSALLPYLAFLIAISLISGVCTGVIARECVKRIHIN